MQLERRSEQLFCVQTFNATDLLQEQISCLNRPPMRYEHALEEVGGVGPEPSAQGPRLWALLIGNDRYPQCPLEGAVKDTLAWESYLIDFLGVPTTRVNRTRPGAIQARTPSARSKAGPRGARGAPRGRFERPGQDRVRSNAAEPPRKKHRDDQGSLHPSWEAAKKAKEAKKVTAAFEGKKISFD